MPRLLILILMLVFASPALAGSELDRPGLIRITSVISRVIERPREHERIFVSRLYNKRITPSAIGHGILTCEYIGRGGVLGAGTWECMGTYSLPRGRIMARGELHVFTFYSLSIVGGIGLYSNVKGEMIASTFSPKQERLLFSLEV